MVTGLAVAVLSVYDTGRQSRNLLANKHAHQQAMQVFWYMQASDQGNMQVSDVML